MEPLLAQIAECHASGDKVVVLIHWGIERDEMPQEYQRALARRYIDAGADLVIGSHPHVLQGIEYYKGKPIFYSLGNFVSLEARFRRPCWYRLHLPETVCHYADSGNFIRRLYPHAD